MQKSSFPRRWTRRRIELEIHELSNDTNNLHWSEHAFERMLERDVSTRQVLSVIRQGKVRRGPDQDQFGDWRVTVRKRSAAGQTVEVALALREGGHGSALTVVTVM